MSRAVMYAESGSMSDQLPRSSVVGAFVSYLALWTIPRWPAIRANVLLWDDHAISLDWIAFLHGYRPVLQLEYWFWEALLPGHITTHLPKIVAALYISATATAIAALLVRWGAPRRLALLTPALFVAHPVLADLGLWNTPAAGVLGCLIIVIAHLLAERESFNAYAFTLLLFLPISIYQPWLGISLGILLLEPLARSLTGLWRPRSSLRKLFLLFIAGALHVAYVFFSRFVLGISGERGWIEAGDPGSLISRKYHATFDMAVNLFMPVVAFYSGLEASWSLWKWIPIAMALAAGAFALSRKTGWYLVALIPAGIIASPVIFIAPTWVISQTPVAWRISAGALIVLLFSLAPILVLTRNRPRTANTVAVVIAAAVGLLLPPTVWDAGTRVVATARDRGVIQAVHPMTGRTPMLVLAHLPRAPEGDSRSMTWGYERVDARYWSAFNDPWVAEHYLGQSDIGMIGWRVRSPRLEERALEACRNSAAPHLGTVMIKGSFMALCVER